MKTTILITILFYIGAWVLVSSFPEIIANYYSGGDAWFTGLFAAGTFTGCLVADICYFFRSRR